MDSHITAQCAYLACSDADSFKLAFVSWRRMRKAAHEALNKVVAGGLNEYQMSEALALVRSGMKDHLAWETHLRRASASLMLTCLYGKRPASLLLT